MADEITVVGGVDTHTDFHQAAVIDSIGRPTRARGCTLY